MQDTKIRYGALILGVALFLAGCNLTQRFEAPDDNAITSAIQAKLYQDPALKTQDVHVVSQKGVVVLNGTVGSDAEKADAEHLAGSISGVKQVVNELSVESPTTTATPPEATARPPVQPRERVSGRAGTEGRRAARRASLESTNESAGAAAPAAAARNPQPPTAQAAAAPPPPSLPVNMTIPAGTVITVRTIDAIDSSRNHPGDEFAATVEAPVVQEDRVVIPRNSDARLRLVSAESAGHIKGRSEVKLQLVSLSAGGMTYPVESGYYDQQGASRGKRSAETIGGGAALGGLIGAIAGHGKGAAIGAAIGAGAGTAVQESSKGQQVVIPSETKLDFTLRSPLTIPVQP